MRTQVKWSVLPVALLMAGTFAMAESRALAAQGSSSSANSSTSAKPDSTAGQRKDNQQDRTANGAQSGQLTASEAAIPTDTVEDRSANGEKAILVATAGVNKTIDDLSRAFAHRDLGEIRQVWPSIPARPFTALEKSFSSFNSASRSFRPENIDFNGDTATVVGSYSGAFINKVANISSSGRFHATLKKTGTRWVVVALACT
jgi:hypothetical protein